MLIVAVIFAFVLGVLVGFRLALLGLDRLVRDGVLDVNPLRAREWRANRR